MTDKELRKLRRSELLEMLLEQKKLAQAAEKRVAEEREKRAGVEHQLQEMDDNCRWLREKLDAKEQELHELRAEMEAQGEQGADAAAARTMMSRINKAVETLENAAEKLRKK